MTERTTRLDSFALREPASLRAVIRATMETGDPLMRRMWRRFLGVIAAWLALAVGPAVAQIEVAGVVLPETVTLDRHTLRLGGCGVRDTLWITHYVAALYVAAPDAAARIVPDPHEPKVIRLYIRDAGWNPDRIPEEYREVLREELARDPYGLVKQHYRALSGGDVVTVSYLPGRGVTMDVNDRHVMAQSGHSLIDAMLDAWSGPDPISKRVRRMQMKHPCQEAQE